MISVHLVLRVFLIYLWR